MRELLEAIFKRSVDGNNSNAFAPIVASLEQVKKNGSGAKKVSFNQLLATLKPLSKEWDKQIEEVISA